MIWIAEKDARNIHRSLNYNWNCANSDIIVMLDNIINLYYCIIVALVLIFIFFDIMLYIIRTF